MGLLSELLVTDSSLYDFVDISVAALRDDDTFICELEFLSSCIDVFFNLGDLVRRGRATL